MWKYSDLDKVTVPQAVQRVADINKWRAAQAEKARLEGMLSADVYKAYPEQDMRWVQLNRPGQFAAESEAMGHSVRGYEPPEGGGYSSYGHGGWEAIKEGRAKIYSLRDKRGEPHVTIEVGPSKYTTPYDYWYDTQGGTMSSPEVQEFIRWVQDKKPERGGLYKWYEQWAEETGRPVAEPPGEITQIKGKSNRAPKEEYLPMIQDFVRSGQWGRVGDLGNTGLVSSKQMFHQDDLTKYRNRGEQVGDYLTEAEYQRLLNMQNEPGFARGGAVTAPPGPAQYDPARIDALAAELMAA